MNSSRRIFDPADNAWPSDDSKDVRLVATAFIEWGVGTRKGITDLPNRLATANCHVVQVIDSLAVLWFDTATDCVAFVSENASPDLRAGLSVGDVLIENGLVHGLPMIEAARLKNLARPGQFLCTRKFRGLAGLSTAAAPGIGEVELKGISEAVEVFELA